MRKMDLNKVNLSAIAAIGHDEQNLGLLVVQGEELEYIEIPAPIEAYEGLQELDEIVNPEQKYLDIYPVAEKSEPQYSYYTQGEYEGQSQEVEVTRNKGLIYEYQRKVEVKISESLSVVQDPDPQELDSSEYKYNYSEKEYYYESRENDQANLANVDYQADSQSLRLEFDDGSVYEYEEVDSRLWEEFKNILD